VKTASTGLTAHLAQPVTRLATLLRVERRDGVVLGFADSDIDVEFGGVVHRARTGATASAVESSADLAVDNLELVGLLSGADVTEADLESGRWDGAAVRVSQVNLADLAQGELVLRVGELGQVERRGGTFRAEIRGLMNALQRTITRAYLPSCDADLGDTRCAANLGGFTHAGSVTAVTDAANFTAAALVQAAAYFDFGLLTWTSGANSGRAMEVRRHLAGGMIELLMAMPEPVLVGDAFTAVAGCNKTLAHCTAKFANVVNYRGFPHVHGIDAMLKRGDL